MRGAIARPSAPGYPPGPVKNRSALAILFVIVFIDLLGFGMVIPVMPLYAERLGASEAWTGLLSAGTRRCSSSSRRSGAACPIGSGAARMLLASIAMTAVAFAVYGLADSFSMLLVSRLFAGAATANIAIARVRRRRDGTGGPRAGHGDHRRRVRSRVRPRARDRRPALESLARAARPSPRRGSPR